MNLENAIVKELATKLGYIYLAHFSAHKNKYCNINVKEGVLASYNDTYHFKGLETYVVSQHSKPGGLSSPSQLSM